MIAAIIITTALIIFFTTYLVMLTKKTKVDRAFMGIENLINKKNSILQQLLSRLRNEDEKLEFSKLEEANRLLLKSQSRSLRVNERIHIERSIKKTIHPLLHSVNRKSSHQMDPSLQRLMDSLSQADYRISVAQEKFNRRASDFNNVINIFPASLIATARKSYQKRDLIDTFAE